MRQFKARIARNSSAIVQRIPALHPFGAGAKNAPGVLYAKICIAEITASGGKIKIHDLIRWSLLFKAEEIATAFVEEFECTSATASHAGERIFSDYNRQACLLFKEAVDAV
jgi:hypothetical protein